MVDFLLSLPTWLGCSVAMATTTGVGFVVYLVFVQFISKYQGYDLKDPINIANLLIITQIKEARRT